MEQLNAYTPLVPGIRDRRHHSITTSLRHVVHAGHIPSEIIEYIYLFSLGQHRSGLATPRHCISSTFYRLQSVFTLEFKGRYENEHFYYIMHVCEFSIVIICSCYSVKQKNNNIYCISSKILKASEKINQLEFDSSINGSRNAL